MTSDHVGCGLDFFLSLVGKFFPRFIGSQFYFSPFVAGRLTPFRPSKLLFTLILEIVELVRLKCFLPEL